MSAELKRAIEQVARTRLARKSCNPRAYCVSDGNGKGLETYLQAEMRRIGKELSELRPIIRAIRRAPSPSTLMGDG